MALEADHPSACILPDVYHLHRGGSGLGGVKLLAPRAIHVFHFNDYPADPPREKLNDADRVYPGDGVAPLAALLQDLADGGFRVMLSLELFNREYWSQDPLTVARTGFDKMNAAGPKSVRAARHPERKARRATPAGAARLVLLRVDLSTIVRRPGPARGPGGVRLCGVRGTSGHWASSSWPAAESPRLIVASGCTAWSS